MSRLKSWLKYERNICRKDLRVFEVANNLLGHFTRATAFRPDGRTQEYLQTFFDLLKAGHHPSRIHSTIDKYAAGLQQGEPGHPTEFLKIMEDE